MPRNLASSTKGFITGCTCPLENHGYEENYKYPVALPEHGKHGGRGKGAWELDAHHMKHVTIARPIPSPSLLLPTDLSALTHPPCIMSNEVARLEAVARARKRPFVQALIKSLKKMP